MRFVEPDTVNPPPSVVRYAPTFKVDDTVVVPDKVIGPAKDDAVPPLCTKPPVTFRPLLKVAELDVEMAPVTCRVDAIDTGPAKVLLAEVVCTSAPLSVTPPPDTIDPYVERRPAGVRVITAEELQS